MGKRGPASRPTNVKLMHGERNLDRLNFNEPVPKPDCPEPPEGITLEERKVFEESAQHLIDMDLAFKADSHALYCYAAAVVAHRQASADVAQNGILVEGITGTLVKNPAAQLQRDNAQTIRAFAQEFGFTPSARSGIQGKDRSGDSTPFAEAS